VDIRADRGNKFGHVRAYRNRPVSHFNSSLDAGFSQKIIALRLFLQPIFDRLLAAACALSSAFFTIAVAVWAIFSG